MNDEALEKMEKKMRELSKVQNDFLLILLRGNCFDDDDDGGGDGDFFPWNQLTLNDTVFKYIKVV